MELGDVPGRHDLDVGVKRCAARDVTKLLSIASCLEFC